MRPELKNMLEKVCELFDDIDEKTSLMKKANAKGKLSNVIKFELVSFLCCLSACDGHISRSEAELIREYFEIDMYPKHVKEFVKANNIISDEYFQTVPESLKIAVKVDNYLIKNGKKIDKGICEIVLELFKIFGKEMVVIDDNVTMEEQVAWSEYISMMMQHIVDCSLLHTQKPEVVPRPGTPIDVDYEMSLNKIGRWYTIFVGKFDDL